MAISRPLFRQRKPSQRSSTSGAALLMAMMIVALISTMTAAMVWQQWRAVQVEVAERARAQSDWLLMAALDWARLILREDARNGGPDHLGEPWAVPLAEARLSTFLAADKNNTDVDLEAFLSGSISDAQARYNLRNLVNKEGVIDPKELRVLQTLFEHINVSRELATLIAKSIEGSIPTPPAPPPDPNRPPNSAQPVVVLEKSNLSVMPHSLQQLMWFGLKAETIRRIEPFVVLLPTPTKVNLNTASREVLAASVEGLDIGTAERLVQIRQKTPFKNLDDVKNQLPSSLILNPDRVDFKSQFFETRGRIRLKDRAIELRTLVRRTGPGAGSGTRVEPLHTELISSSDLS